jgi:hypothetical protein
LDDFAALLRVHGIDDLADQLDAVRVALPESNTFDADVQATHIQNSRGNSEYGTGNSPR